MTVPPKFVHHDPTAWWRENEARQREQMASAQLQATLWQQRQQAAMAQGRAEGLAAERHRELMAATIANRPRPGFLESVPSAWLAAAGIAAYRAWKRRPSEVVIGYRRG